MKGSRLGDYVSFSSGGTPSKKRPDFYGGELPWITGADIKGLESISPRSFLTETGAAASSVLQPGDLALVTRTSVGKVAVVDTPLAFSQDITGIHADSRLDIRYIARFLEANSERLARQARGATIKGVTRQVVASLPFSPPSLSEQRRIAAILDQTDAIRTKRRQALAHLDSLPRALLAEIVASPETTFQPLTEVTVTNSGGTPDRKRADYYGGSIPWVKSGELHHDSITFTEESLTPAGLAGSSAKLFPKGTVVMAMYGATAGVVSRLGIDAATNQAICAFQPRSNIRETYLMWALRAQTQSLLFRRTGGAQPNLSQATIQAFPIPVPPLSAQLEFEQKILKIATLRGVVKQCFSHEDQLFASLQSRAFKGEL